MSVASADRRDDVVRLLSDAPEGLSDGDLARALGDGVRPQTVNTLCRRMATAGVVERVGTRPIRTRLLDAPAGTGRDDTPTPDPTPHEPTPHEHEPTPDEPRPEDAPTQVTATPEASPEDPVAEEAAAPPAEAAPGSGPPARLPVMARPADATPRADENGAARPVRDVLQAWSRTVNVQAAVATWLWRRGATIRSATRDGSTTARDLVARLDGDEVHVEITGWPPDGDRTHPTTIAADWFSAAARAAARRRDAQPHSRIVIAVPDTRRYRALAVARDADLAGARAEVWFVDPSGAVEESDRNR